MPKVRLNKESRKRLLKHARSLLATAKMDAQLGAASLAAQEAAYQHTLACYDQEDMKIFEKYGQHVVVTSIDLNDSMKGKVYAYKGTRSHPKRQRTLYQAQEKMEVPMEWNVLPGMVCKIDFPPGKTAMVPYGRAGWRLSEQLTDDFYDPLHKARKMWEQKRKHVAEYMLPYENLVGPARYLEDVIEIWPEAANAGIVARRATALVPLSEAHKARITADVAAREAGEAPLADVRLEVG